MVRVESGYQAACAAATLGIVARIPSRSSAGSSSGGMRAAYASTRNTVCALSRGDLLEDPEPARAIAVGRSRPLASRAAACSTMAWADSRAWTAVSSACLATESRAQSVLLRVSDASSPTIRLEFLIMLSFLQR
jgi:hypothetical protein